MRATGCAAAEKRRPRSTDFLSSFFFYYYACRHVLLQKNEGHIQSIFLRLFFDYYSVFTTAHVLLRSQPEPNKLHVATRPCCFGANKRCFGAHRPHPRPPLPLFSALLTCEGAVLQPAGVALEPAGAVLESFQFSIFEQ